MHRFGKAEDFQRLIRRFAGKRAPARERVDDDRSHGPRGRDQRRDPQASFAVTGTTAFGFLNTSTFPTITNTRPINAGTVHW